MSSLDLRLGDWRTVLADVGAVDAVITDPPYSPRVHEGQRTGSETAKSQIDYAALSPETCAEFVAAWAPRTRHWFVIFSDHLGAWWWEHALQAAGLYVFAPVLWVRRNATPRVAGDGPTSAADYIVVARPRRRLAEGRSGSRPGFYDAIISSRTIEHTGGKTIDGMRAIVRDYTLETDLVCDPFSGAATTLIAAAIEGRRAIGAEIDPETHRKAMARIARGYTPSMFTKAASTIPPVEPQASTRAGE